MKKPVSFTLILLFSFQLYAQKKIRQPIDTVGFATKAWQMDSVVKRIDRIYDTDINSTDRNTILPENTAFRLAICPHDDYAYAGFLYEKVIPHIKAKTVIIFGVAHKATKFNVEQKLVFDSFDEWKEPYGNCKISPLREEIIKNLSQDAYLVHDSLQQAEHSVEAIIPFLQYYNRDVLFVPILVPAMNFSMMKKYSLEFATVLDQVMNKNNQRWGEDVAIVISNDAVHYGDEEWGGTNYAQYGCDMDGYKKAVNHEKEIIDTSLLPGLDTSNIHRFFSYTVQPQDWHTYQWPWCGRYSVPFGLLTGFYLNEIRKEAKLQGVKLGYSTSIAQEPLPVDDLNMGKTAIATLHHWVGFTAIGYE